MIKKEGRGDIRHHVKRLLFVKRRSLLRYCLVLRDGKLPVPVVNNRFYSNAGLHVGKGFVDLFQ